MTRLIACCLLLASVLAAHAVEPQRLVTHNGSLMEVLVDPADATRVQIVYVSPKPSLRAIGIAPGTLLIFGQWSADVFDGVAHVYTVCGALPYSVTGAIDPNESLVLEGPAPRVWEGTCTIADYVWTHNSTLRFDRLPIPVQPGASLY